MEHQISGAAMLGIVLLALAAIIGLGFGVFIIAKGTANEGSASMQEGLNTVGNSAFTDFDQKIVRGAQITSALQSWAGKSVSVLVATQAVKDNTTAHGAIPTTAAGFSAYNSGTLYLTKAFADKAYAKPVESAKSTTGKAMLTFVQYNAILNGTTGTATGGLNASSQIYFDSDCWRATDGYRTAEGKVVASNITTNLSKSGMLEYIPSSAKFQSYLIKDLSGTYMGIAAEQISTN